eukprot:g7037.t1
MSTVGMTEKELVSGIEITGTETDYSHPIFSSDEFMMYYYKVAPCGKTYRHDWRVCPFAHVGETAARRHPKYYPYVGVICPETKKGEKCPRGDSCPCTHSLFEYWLHPTRFKTEFCSRGSSCSRSFCFFAHKESEVRTFNANVLSSPMARKALSIADGNSAKQQDQQQRCIGTSLPAPINMPFSALDLGLAGQNIWSMRPFEFSSNEDMCRKSMLPSTLPTSYSSFGATTPVQSPLNLWESNGSMPLLDHGFSTNAFAPNEIVNYPRSSGIWNDLRLQPHQNETNCQDLEILATLCKLLAEN